MEELTHIELFFKHGMNHTRAAKTINVKPNAFRDTYFRQLKILCRETGHSVRDFWNSEMKQKGGEIQALLEQYNRIAKGNDFIRDNLVLIGFIFYPEHTEETEKLFESQRYTGFYKYQNDDTDLNLRITWTDWTLYDGPSTDKILAQGSLTGLNIQTAVALLITWGKNKS
ncbi:MAG: hypothetical protein JWR50_3016 [Mucilaginibacter sp.]|nr:hypothetical protein [Mucilaginibacter sp.]